MKALSKSAFQFKGQTQVYNGKVRDMYTIGSHYIVSVASDRISAFDVILPKAIPFKGQVLNQIAAHFLDATSDIIPNWLMAQPQSHVSVGKKCEPFKVEMVIRGYLAGHAWREYKAGKRQICGVPLPDGLVENQKLPHPIITPTTKVDQGGHDEDISEEEILKQGIVSAEDYAVLKKSTSELFDRGTQMAAEKGLILVDTKYEFGKTLHGDILLIDEVHTPDSSRYFMADDYQTAIDEGRSPKQLSKEFVREWLMSEGFMGKEGQTVPDMTDEIIETISQKYIHLYEHITGKTFVPTDYSHIQKDIQQVVDNWIANLVD